MAAEIVDDDDIAWFEGRQKELLDIGEEALAIDGTVNDAGSLDPVATERRQEGERSPTSLGHFGKKRPSARCPAAQACHIGLGPGLIDEDQPSRVDAMLICPPALTPSRYVGPILFGGEQRFF